uniref:Uncharacterized protein n=1 Tax=Pleurostomum flabellatum TaxID=405751 RepID=A0A7T0M444_9EUKA|nr:hypothetical protein J6731_mgp54 [Pleurostomum flabellatum]QPL15642.1 hypothetical protein [Pleurostomum flabellatum]
MRSVTLLFNDDIIIVTFFEDLNIVMFQEWLYEAIGKLFF